ncbi:MULTISPECIES: hypothetical protein [Streptomyces]|uniref:Uncharacterized protein n=1 Tax=Streptomyces sanyensis TaxID=568869 RepID=A0ABP9A481_9ACTN
MARTTAPTRWQRVSTGTDPAPAAPPGAGTPIYDRLAAEWAAAGRTLPGRPDAEWRRLTVFPPVPDGGLGPLLPPPARRGWLYDRHTA